MSADAETTEETTYDVVILGGGSGGYACALRAAELGLTRRPRREGQARWHLPAPRLHPDQGAAARRRGRRHRPRGRAVRRQVDLRVGRHGGRQRLQGRRRRPSLQGPAGPGQGPQDRPGRGRGPARRPPHRRGRRHAGHAAATSCSRPAPTPESLPGLEIGGRIMTSDQALDLDHVPPRVVVLGGGVIGVEFASACGGRSASEVTIVEALPRLVPAEDEAISKALERAFRKRRIAFKTGVRFAGATQDGDAVTGHARGRRRASRPTSCSSPSAAGRSPTASATRRPASPSTAASSRPTSGCAPASRACMPSATSSPASSSPTAGSPRASSWPRRSPGWPRRRSTRPASRGSPTATPRSPRSASPRRRPREKYGESRDLRVQPRRQRQEPDPADRRASSSSSARRTARSSAST